MINAHFAADSSVNNRQQCSGDLNQVDTAHEGGGNESRQVTDYAASQGNHQCISCETPFQQSGVEPSQFAAAFGFFAWGDNEFFSVGDDIQPSLKMDFSDIFIGYYCGSMLLKLGDYFPPIVVEVHIVASFP